MGKQQGCHWDNHLDGEPWKEALGQTDPAKQATPSEILNQNNGSKANHRCATIELLGMAMEAVLRLFKLGHYGGSQLSHGLAHIIQNKP